MAGQKSHSFRTRTSVLAILALAVPAILLVLPPIAEGHPDTLFGMPLVTAVGWPIALPALAIALFLFARRQNEEDERARDDE